jgi:hypothetical protein
LIGPIVGLFKSRRCATQIEKVKLESFKFSPVSRFKPASPKLARSFPEATPNLHPESGRRVEPAWCAAACLP